MMMRTTLSDLQALYAKGEKIATLTCYDGNGNIAQTVPPAGVAANSLTPRLSPTTQPPAAGR